MSHNRSSSPWTDEHLQSIDPIELFSLCAQNTVDNDLWTEFLKRYAPRIKVFIRSCVSRSLNEGNFHSSFDVNQESDLFQNVIIRLVKNGCAAMQQFSGKNESDLLAYLAVLARSVVRDCQRRRWALKRAMDRMEDRRGIRAQTNNLSMTFPSAVQDIERKLLAREIGELCARTLKSLPAPHTARDQLIFTLYFIHNMSMDQIVQCKGINLTKPGIQRVLDRLKERVRAAAAVGSNAEITP